MKKETQCVHSGTYHDGVTGGVNTPIFTSSASRYIDREELTYPRYFNTPNQKAIVEKLCALEGAEDGVLFSSGMAAISTAILSFAGNGDHIVLLDELYGGTHAFAAKQFDRIGITYTFVPVEADAVCKAVSKDTKVIVIESPTNPLLSVINVRNVAGFAKSHGIVTLMDSTFATPIHQNPIELGIDIVMHSGTKYLGGHSDLCCGIIVTSKEKAARIRDLATHLGGSLNAPTCSLFERSLKTLALRVSRQTENAGMIAEFLERHGAVRRVNYPGLKSFSGHAIARSQMRGFGAMLSFELDAGKIDPVTFVRALQLIEPAVSLGGVESTICSPAVTSHEKLTADERRRIGISDSLLRLSVGIEHVDDLIEDLKQALDKQEQSDASWNSEKGI